MTTPSLADLPPDLHWLIHMEPTRDDMDSYFDGQPPSRMLSGAHTTPFTVTNIFADQAELTARQPRYGLLASPSATTLLELSEPGHRFLMTTLPTDDEIANGVSVSCPVRNPDGTVEYLTEKSFPNVLAKFVKEYQRAYQEHRDDIWGACKELHAIWSGAYTKYGFTPNQKGKFRRSHGIPHYLIGKPCNNPLYLTPYISPLPTVELLDELCLGYCLGDLVFLTARHELGHIYLRVQAWHERALHRGYADPHDAFLNADDWGLLSARACGHRYRTTTTITDDELRTRHDAPVEVFESVSDMARLYWEMGQWSEKVYLTVVTAPLCERQGCTRFRRPYNGYGRPDKYCSDECGKLAERQKATVRQRRHREKLEREQPLPHFIQPRRHA